MLSKNEVKEFLQGQKYDELFRNSTSARKLSGILTSLTYDKKDVIAWRAMEAIGLLSGEIAKTDPEHVRNTVGRLLWMIRDESGGIGWSVPEILGEIVRNNRKLCADIAPIVASFHEELMLRTGVMWAVGRIGAMDEDFNRHAVPIVTRYLDAPDRTCRAYAAWAAGQLNASGAAAVLEKLISDTGQVFFYEKGELVKKRVGEIAKYALAAIKPSGDRVPAHMIK